MSDEGLSTLNSQEKSMWGFEVTIQHGIPESGNEFSLNPIALIFPQKLEQLFPFSVQ